MIIVIKKLYYFNENKEKDDKKSITFKNKKFELKLKNMERHSLELTQKVKDILMKINDNKNIDFEDLKININQELINNEDKYIGYAFNGKKE